MNRRRFLLTLPAVALAAACGRGSKPDSSGRVQAPPAATVQISPLDGVPAPKGTPTPAPPPQLCLVTRQIGVPETYVPSDLVTLPPDLCAQADVRLRQAAAQALQLLLTDALSDGQRMLALSGYRSFEQQQATLVSEIKNYGEAQARRQVAEPGHSEHQLGEAVDLVTARNPFYLEQSFGSVPEGRWVAANCARYGFVISYPQGKEVVTGYIYEPWHIRYVGAPLAQQVVASGLTLTEYLPAHGMAGCAQ